jgi:DNA-directed RNA polymerase specialized sigma subunit
MITECQRLNAEIAAHQAEIVALSRKRSAFIMMLNRERDLGMREIGRRLGITGPRVTQIIAAARLTTASLSEYDDEKPDHRDEDRQT